MDDCIILVSIIDGNELNLLESRAFPFSAVDKAEDYFISLIKENFNESENWTKEDFDECLDDGYYENDTHFCVYINEIKYER